MSLVTKKAKTRKRRPFYTPPPRIVRAASSVTGLSPTPPAGAVAVSNHDSLVDVHRRLLGEMVFLRNQVRDVMARRDLLIQQARESARWELMREWLEKRVEHWNPKEEYRRYLFLSRGIGQKPGGPTQAVTPRSDVGSRFSKGPSFSMIPPCFCFLNY